MSPKFDTHCDKCNESMNEKDGIFATGYRIELVCECCADKMQFCHRCERSGDDEAFSYGSDICNNCCDYEADKLMDNDQE